jgi:hypothetical protein
LLPSTLLPAAQPGGVSRRTLSLIIVLSEAGMQ